MVGAWGSRYLFWAMAFDWVISYGGYFVAARHSCHLVLQSVSEQPFKFLVARMTSSKSFLQEAIEEAWPIARSPATKGRRTRRRAEHFKIKTTNPRVKSTPLSVGLRIRSGV